MEQRDTNWLANLDLGRKALKDEDWTAAEEYFRLALEAAMADEAPGPEASACGFLAQLCLRNGRGEEGLRWARRGKKLADTIGETAAATHFDELVRAAEAATSEDLAPLRERVQQGMAALEQGSVEAAIPLLEDAVALAAESGERSIEGQMQLELARALLQAERPEDARACAEAALPIAAELGAVTLSAMLAALIEESKLLHGRHAMGRAVTAMEDGDPDGALDILVRAQEQDDLVGIERAFNLGMQVRALLQAGRADEAKNLAEQARAIAVEAEDDEAEQVFVLLAQHAAQQSPKS